MSAFLAALLTSLVATRVLARLAVRHGWVDRPDAERKTQARAVPQVGGVAVALGLAAGLALADAETRARLLGGALGLPPAAGAAALGLALLAGTLDDFARGGLRPRTKLLLQALACAPLVSALLAAGSGLALAVLAGVAGVAALNAGNTYDNADGALGGLAMLGLLVPAPLAAAAVAGFLPLNLDGRRAPRGAPTAYLGDAGSHLLAMLLVLQPLAWPAFLLPAADLVRLSIVRVRAGSRPWIGDRRHLAHRLEALGLGPRGVALTLVAIAAPVCLASGWGSVALVVGTAATLSFFLLALGRTPAPVTPLLRASRR